MHPPSTRSAALTARTEVRVDWRYRVRSDAQVTDYDAALTQEQALLKDDLVQLQAHLADKLQQVADLSASTGLREAGHAVHLNGHGLCVAVPRDRKAEPISCLARREITVRDLEVLDDVTIPEARS